MALIITFMNIVVRGVIIFIVTQSEMVLPEIWMLTQTRLQVPLSRDLQLTQMCKCTHGQSTDAGPEEIRRNHAQLRAPSYKIWGERSQNSRSQRQGKKQRKKPSRLGSSMCTHLRFGLRYLWQAVTWSLCTFHLLRRGIKELQGFCRNSVEVFTYFSSSLMFSSLLSSQEQKWLKNLLAEEQKWYMKQN